MLKVTTNGHRRYFGTFGMLESSLWSEKDQFFLCIIYLYPIWMNLKLTSWPNLEPCTTRYDAQLQPNDLKETSNGWLKVSKKRIILNKYFDILTSTVIQSCLPHLFTFNGWLKIQYFLSTLSSKHHHTDDS